VFVLQTSCLLAVNAMLCSNLASATSHVAAAANLSRELWGARPQKFEKCAFDNLLPDLTPYDSPAQLRKLEGPN